MTDNLEFEKAVTEFLGALHTLVADVAGVVGDLAIETGRQDLAVRLTSSLNVAREQLSQILRDL